MFWHGAFQEAFGVRICALKWFPCIGAVVDHPGGSPGANLKSISHRYHPILVAFVWELTKETIQLPLGCLQDGWRHGVARANGYRCLWLIHGWCER